MTGENLVDWVMEHYFKSIPQDVVMAQKIMDKQGIDVAVEYLKQVCADGSMGFSGPGKPRYDTNGGKVRMWSPVDCFNRPPDLEVDIEKFCRQKLESFVQSRMM